MKKQKKERGKRFAASVPYAKNGLRKLFYVEQIVVFLAFLDKDAAALKNIVGSKLAIFGHLGFVDRNGVLLQLAADFALGGKHTDFGSEVD